MHHWDESFDVVIVGSGGGGLCAGLTVATAGKKAVVIEKMPKIGGTTAKSGGVIWVPCNRLLREAGVHDTIEDALAYMRAVAEGYNGPAASLARQEAYVRGGIEMIDFLLDQGIELIYLDGWSDHYAGGLARGRLVGSKVFSTKNLGDWLPKLETYMTSLPITGKEVGKLALVKRTREGFMAGMKLALGAAWGRMTGWPRMGLGAGLQGQLLSANLRHGTSVWTECPVTDLIEENGRVAGVRVQRNGREILVQAHDGVILNAGSFTKNQALRERYLPHPTSAAWSLSSDGDTGDLIEPLLRLGAGMEQLGKVNWAPVSVMPDGTALLTQNSFTKPFSFIVDQQGERFCNESSAGFGMVETMYRRNATKPTIPAWMIMDSRHVNAYPFVIKPPGPISQEWIDSGFFKTASTIEGLAEQCGIPPNVLRATADRFNGFARSGHDLDFHRGEWAYERYYGDTSVHPNPSLGPVEKPPFYATRIWPGDGGMFGGVSTDEYARVVREDGGIIPGLYASGTTAVHVFGRDYPCSGGAVGFSLCWGYIAARHAVSLNGPQH